MQEPSRRRYGIRPPGPPWPRRARVAFPLLCGILLSCERADTVVHRQVPVQHGLTDARVLASGERDEASGCPRSVRLGSTEFVLRLDRVIQRRENRSDTLVVFRSAAGAYSSMAGDSTLHVDCVSLRVLEPDRSPVRDGEPDG